MTIVKKVITYSQFATFCCVLLSLKAINKIMKFIFTFLLGFAFSMATFAQASSANVAKNNIKKTKIESPAATTSAQTSVAATTDTKPNTEALNLKETEFDFGKIPQGKPVTHVFEFTNAGTTPFSLENVQASCGCTTPVWKKDVVAPGATASIVVGYNAQNEGPFAKPVTITYNGNQVKQITIKGDVWKTPVTSAPANTSLNSLKNEQ
jgi:hypothetical protein